jgi:hypothetical protein
MTLTAVGIVLVIVGLCMGGLGIAGRIRAAKMIGSGGSKGWFRRGNTIYEARRLYELPDHGLTVRNLLKASSRLIVAGASLCVAGLVSIL